MKKLLIGLLALALITPPVFLSMYSKDAAKAADFTPPVINTDPNCRMTTLHAIESWRSLYPESTFLTTVTGNDAQRAIKLYNELPPRSGAEAVDIYVFSHPKVKGVQVFADKSGCLTVNVFLPDFYYKMLIGKAK